MWKGTSDYRTADHALQWPMWFGKLNPNGTPGDKYDVFNILDSQPADQTFVSPAALKTRSQSGSCHSDA